MSLIIAIIVYVNVLFNLGYYNNCYHNPNCPHEQYFTCDPDNLQSSCSEILEEFTDSDFNDFILHLHNDYRNSIANGSSEVMPSIPADRMAKMVWCDELAEAALQNARLCKDENVKCVNTIKWKNVGQNKAIIKVTDQGPFVAFSPNDLAEKCMLDWLDEARHNTFTNHFGTLIQANGTSVGCAALLELDEQSVQINFRLVCHYARGINPDMAVYHIGEPGSACLTGTDHTYPALCSENEKFDPNSNIRVYYSEHHSDSNESSAEETES